MKWCLEGSTGKERWGLRREEEILSFYKDGGRSRTDRWKGWKKKSPKSLGKLSLGGFLSFLLGRPGFQTQSCTGVIWKTVSIRGKVLLRACPAYKRWWDLLRSPKSVRISRKYQIKCETTLKRELVYSKRGR